MLTTQRRDDSSETPKSQKIPNSKSPRCPNSKIPTFQDSNLFEIPEFRVPNVNNSKIKNTSCEIPKIPNSAIPKFQISKIPKFQNSNYTTSLCFPENRHRLYHMLNSSENKFEMKVCVAFLCAHLRYLHVDCSEHPFKRHLCDFRSLHRPHDHVHYLVILSTTSPLSVATIS